MDVRAIFFANQKRKQLERQAEHSERLASRCKDPKTADYHRRHAQMRRNEARRWQTHVRL